MEGPSGPDRALAAHVHRRDLGEDQNMAPLRGWGTRGRRLKAYAPHAYWKTLTFIAALRHDRIDAPWVIDGPINGQTFLLYIEKILDPTLSPGDVVVLDNLGSHKRQSRPRHRKSKSPPPRFPAALQSRPQSHRAGRRQAQTSRSKGSAARRRSHLAKGRRATRPLQPNRMCKLPRKLRLWFRISESCLSYDFSRRRG